MDDPRTAVDFAVVAGSRRSGAGRMEVMRASEYWDRGAAVFDGWRIWTTYAAYLRLARHTEDLTSG